jgi:diguanylate cyclase (GGDEF)-like protein
MVDSPATGPFMDRAKDAIIAARIADGKLSVLVLDLDNFKELNDTLGHDAGDALLRRIGPRLRRVLRSHDTIARLGGDELAILLDPRPDDEGAARVAAKLLRALDATPVLPTLEDARADR